MCSGLRERRRLILREFSFLTHFGASELPHLRAKLYGRNISPDDQDVPAVIRKRLNLAVQPLHTYFIPVSLNRFPYLSTFLCPICDLSVPLETANTDEYGRPFTKNATYSSWH
jgi:hypothetical protein